MKKMNGLKIFALVLLSLNKFETMFGMKKDEKEDNINDEYVNKNYYLIDHLGNKITLDNGDDIKFKINNEEIGLEEFNMNEKILKIKENGVEKILAYEQSPFLCIDNAIHVGALQNKIVLRILPDVELGKKTLDCDIVKKIGEDSINDDYILVDAENNKKEKIKDKKIVFKLLTRNKYLELKEKLNQQENWLKNSEGKYILDDSQKPLLFEEEENYLILYVRRTKNNLWLANLLLFVADIVFNKDNSIEVRMAKMVKKEEIPMAKKEEEIAKKEELLKVEKKEEDDDSSKCCCGIC